jgi:hypothetical protein
MIGALPAKFQIACTRDSICAIIVRDRSFEEDKLDPRASACFV